MIFKKTKNNGEKRIVAFIDYEHWYISMETLHNKCKPDLASWFADLNSKGKIVDAIFFGDFSKGNMKNEITRIRRFSNKIIDTCNPNPKSVKDFTDFIILDNIYQRAMSSDDIDVFVIFSGDGHFCSAAAFLRNNMDKEVGIYGVSGAMSKVLKDTASWCVEIPEGLSKRFLTSQILLNTIRKLEKDKMRLITSDSVLHVAQADSQMDVIDLKNALDYLESKKIIRINDLIFEGKNQHVLNTDWDCARTAGYKIVLPERSND